MDITGGLPPAYTLLFGTYFGTLLKIRKNVEEEWEKRKGEVEGKEMKPMIMITGEIFFFFFLFFILDFFLGFFLYFFL